MAALHAAKAAKKHKSGKDAPPIVVSDAEEAALDAADAEEAPSTSAAPPPEVQELLELAKALESEADNLAAQREADSPL